MKVLFKSQAADFLKAVKTCSECAGESKKSNVLNSIKFSKNLDGAILCESASGISYAQTILNGEVMEGFDSIIIESDSFKPVLTVLKNPYEEVTLAIDESTNNVVISTSNSGLFTILSEHRHDRNYVDLNFINSILNRADDFSTGLSIEILTKLIKIAKNNKAKHVKLSFASDNNKRPIAYEVDGARGIVMPVRIN